MRINKIETISTLDLENTKLNAQIALCDEQEQTMLNVSCSELGLTGEGYNAIESRIQTRPLIIRTHSFAYEAIRSANISNSNLLSGLPDSMTAGVLDTDECDTEIEKIKQQIGRLNSAWDSLVSQAQISSESCHRISPATTISTINNTYSGLISAKEEMLRHWEGVKEAAFRYNTASSHMYTNAKDFVNRILSQASSAVEGCIANGSYDSSAYENLVSDLTIYRVRHARPYLTPEELAIMTA